MTEKITPRLVQEEIEKACQEHGARMDVTLFGKQKGCTVADVEQAKFARRVAIAGIVQRTGATQTAISKAWGCEIDFILKAYPHEAFESKGLTKDQFAGMVHDVSILRGVQASEILDFGARGRSSPARLDLIELVIKETQATPSEIADCWGCTRKQVTDYLEERGINRMELILQRLKYLTPTYLATIGTDTNGL